MTQSIQLANGFWCDANGQDNGTVGIFLTLPDNFLPVSDVRRLAAQWIAAADEADDLTAEADKAKLDQLKRTLDEAYDSRENVERFFGHGCGEWPGTVPIAEWLDAAGFTVVKKGER